MGKAPARHMKDWHHAFLTGQSNEHLLDIAGPNTCLLSPRGSAKSTVIGMLVAWLIGRHALAKKLLRTLYVSYNVDVARNKSAAIKNLISNKEYQEFFRQFVCLRPARAMSCGPLTSTLRRSTSEVKTPSRWLAQA